MDFFEIKTPGGRSKKATLNETHGQGSVKGTGFGFVLDLVAGMVGMFAGAFVGNVPSVILGSATMLAGHYFNLQPLRPLGLMMALTPSQSRDKDGIKTTQPWSKGFDLGTEASNGMNRVKNLVGNVTSKISLMDYKQGGGSGGTTQDLEGFLAGFAEDLQKLDALAAEQVANAVAFSKTSGILPSGQSTIPMDAYSMLETNLEDF
ncbi:MAG: hypothetical protein H6581_20610 [Bacteroidia bacterium]|nr:hypothetical protein [Bacteroidia bacterium]